MDFKDYIKGKRHGKEANRIERESLDDPFIQEAIDGFDAIDGDHFQSIENLEKLLEQRMDTTRMTTGSRMRIIGIAASVMLLIGIGSLFLLNRTLQVDNTAMIAASGVADTTIVTEDVPLAMNKIQAAKEEIVEVPSQPKEVSVPPAPSMQAIAQPESNDMVMEVTNDIEEEIIVETYSYIDMPDVIEEPEEVAFLRSSESEDTANYERSFSSAPAAQNSRSQKEKASTSYSTRAMTKSAAQSPDTLKILVVDAVTKEPLAGASVKRKKSDQIITTDPAGIFAIPFVKNMKITVSCEGYDAIELTLLPGLKEIQLQPAFSEQK